MQRGAELSVLPRAHKQAVSKLESPCLARNRVLQGDTTFCEANLLRGEYEAYRIGEAQGSSCDARILGVDGGS